MGAPIDGAATPGAPLWANPARRGIRRGRTPPFPRVAPDRFDTTRQPQKERHMAEATPGTGVFDRLLKDRIIWLGSEVRDENANEIAAKLLLLAAEDPKKDIYLYVNSPGGSITAGMAIYDTMQFVPNDIVTVGIGMAASMGQLLLTAGTKGKRYITPNARVLLHQPHGGFGGTSSDIQTQAQLIVSMKNRLAEITAAQTGKSVEQINADGDRDRWFTAQEALEYGFVDHIRESALDVAGGGGTQA
nr:ATP-dependent Clp protease proteolytic subunit [Agromyces aureus]